MSRFYLVTILLGTTVVMAESNVTKSLPDTKSTTLSMEEQIKKALGEVESIKVMKGTKSKIVSESKAEVLDEDKLKIEKKRTVKKKKHVKRKRTVKQKNRVKRRVKKVVVETKEHIDSLPMAKTYSMDYDTSKIKE